ncbi:MAG: hypothetical protein GY928_21245 [Colwellia sp.]|nr:hypothetical protein [Colwellia sp.]
MSKSKIVVSIPDQGNVYFDLVRSITFPSVSTITRNKRSRDTDVADHTADTNGVITMEVKVSNSPVVFYQDNLINAKLNEKRDQVAYILLKKIKADRTLVTIQHRYDSHYNYQLIEFDPKYLAEEAIGFTLKFEEVRYAYEQEVDLVQKMSTPKKEDASGDSKGDGSKDKADTESEYMSANTWHEIINTFKDSEPKVEAN